VDAGSSKKMWQNKNLYRSAFERTRSKALAKPEWASALMRRTPWYRRVEAKARGY
jgi:hypothetical protein